jgi:hypothetical protein
MTRRAHLVPRPLFVLPWLAACGGGATSAPPAATPASTAPSSDPPAPARPAPDAEATSGKAEPTADVKALLAAPYDDPTESAGPIQMPPLLSSETSKTSFPKATTGDRECWQRLGLTGDHKKDYDAIIARCGEPTGLAEYAKPVTGRVHSVRDRRDTYVLKLAHGLCYRYFAVGGRGIADLDILVTKKGALVAADKTSQPIAIIDVDRTWCMDSDEEYEFNIEVKGEGTGAYTFGVWAKPKA